MSNCKKGDLRCSLGFETRNNKVSKGYDSDYICNPNEHGWSFVPDINFFKKVEFIKKCDDPNNPTVYNKTPDPNIKNDYGYRYVMSNGKFNPSMKDKFIYPDQPIRNSCIKCKSKKGGYKNKILFNNINMVNKFSRKKNYRKKKSRKKVSVKRGGTQTNSKGNKYSFTCGWTGINGPGKGAGTFTECKGRKKCYMKSDWDKNFEKAKIWKSGPKYRKLMEDEHKGPWHYQTVGKIFSKMAGTFKQNEGDRGVCM